MNKSSKNGTKNSNSNSKLIKRENKNTIIILVIAIIIGICIYYYFYYIRSNSVEEQFSDENNNQNKLTCDAKYEFITRNKLQTIRDIIRIKLQQIINNKGKTGLTKPDNTLNKDNNDIKYLLDTFQKFDAHITAEDKKEFTEFKDADTFVKFTIDKYDEHNTKGNSIYTIMTNLTDFKKECETIIANKCGDKHTKLCELMDSELVKINCQGAYTSIKGNYDETIHKLKLKLKIINKGYDMSTLTDNDKMANAEADLKDDLDKLKTLEKTRDTTNNILKSLINGIYSPLSASFPTHIIADLTGIINSLDSSNLDTINKTKDCLENMNECYNCINMKAKATLLIELLKPLTISNMNMNDIITKITAPNLFPEWSTELPTPDATASPTPTATTSPTPDATASPTPDATASPTPGATASQTSGATASQTSGATEGVITSTETQEMYQRVRDELAQLYNNSSGELSDFLKEALKSLTPSQRKGICQSYCTSFTPCTELCKLTECTNCSGTASGDIDMTGMGFPDTSLGYAGIDDQYSLLDNINDTATNLDVNVDLNNLANKKLMGPSIIQKDTNGISNIFAPYIIMTPKRQNETYGTYLLEDPNDPFQKRFIESVMANY